MIESATLIGVAACVSEQLCGQRRTEFSDSFEFGTSKLGAGGVIASSTIDTHAFQWECLKHSRITGLFVHSEKVFQTRDCGAPETSHTCTKQLSIYTGLAVLDCLRSRKPNGFKARRLEWHPERVLPRSPQINSASPQINGAQSRVIADALIVVVARLVIAFVFARDT